MKARNVTKENFLIQIQRMSNIRDMGVNQFTGNVPGNLVFIKN
jgi:hypothetical protein